MSDITLTTHQAQLTIYQLAQHIVAVKTDCLYMPSMLMLVTWLKCRAGEVHVTLRVDSLFLHSLIVNLTWLSSEDTVTSRIHKVICCLVIQCYNHMAYLVHYKGTESLKLTQLKRVSFLLLAIQFLLCRVNVCTSRYHVSGSLYQCQCEHCGLSLIHI